MATPKATPASNAALSPANNSEENITKANQEQKLQADPNPELSNFQVNAKPNSSIEERINRFCS